MRRSLVDDPDEARARAEAAIRSEARLDHLPAPLAEAAVAMVLACGMVDLPNRLAWSEGFAEAFGQALASGGPVLCDDAMTMAALSAAGAERERLARLGVPGTGNAGIAVIGREPLALARLLEARADGRPAPPVVLAMPPGLVNAAESKAALAGVPLGLAFLTLRGRRGGAEIAAAAFAALARGR